MTPQRTVRSLNWMLIGLPAALLGGLFFVLARGAGTPGEGQTVFYPAVMLYNYAVIQFAILIVLAAALLLMLWIPQAIRRRPRYAWNGLAVALAVGGAALACWGSLPRALLANNYVHLDRAALAGRMFQLGARIAVDGDNYYVLCDCAQPGVVCRCRRLREAGAPAFTARPVLLADAGAGTLSIRIGAETLLTLRP